MQHAPLIKTTALSYRYSKEAKTLDGVQEAEEGLRFVRLSMVRYLKYYPNFKLLNLKP
jgi:hypothetical protein